MVEEITVRVTYKDISEEIRGQPDVVWTGVNRFFANNFPTMALLSKIILTVDTEELIERLHNIIKITPDGEVYLTTDRKLLTDKEAIMIYLVGTFLTQRLGYSERGTLTIGDLCSMTGKPRKLVSTRLSELCARRWAMKDERKNFTATINGVKQFVDKVIPKIERRAAVI